VLPEGEVGLSDYRRLALYPHEARVFDDVSLEWRVCEYHSIPCGSRHTIRAPTGYRRGAAKYWTVPEHLKTLSLEQWNRYPRPRRQLICQHAVVCRHRSCGGVVLAERTEGYNCAKCGENWPRNHGLPTYAVIDGSHNYAQSTALLNEDGFEDDDDEDIYAGMLSVNVASVTPLLARDRSYPDINEAYRPEDVLRCMNSVIDRVLFERVSRVVSESGSFAELNRNLRMAFAFSSQDVVRAEIRSEPGKSEKRKRGKRGSRKMRKLQEKAKTPFCYTALFDKRDRRFVAEDLGMLPTVRSVFEHPAFKGYRGKSLLLEEQGDILHVTTEKRRKFPMTQFEWQLHNHPERVIGADADELNMFIDQFDVGAAIELARSKVMIERVMAEEEIVVEEELPEPLVKGAGLCWTNFGIVVPFADHCDGMKLSVFLEHAQQWYSKSSFYCCVDWYWQEDGDLHIEHVKTVAKPTAASPYFSIPNWLGDYTPMKKWLQVMEVYAGKPRFAPAVVGYSDGRRPDWLAYLNKHKNEIPTQAMVKARHWLAIKKGKYDDVILIGKGAFDTAMQTFTNPEIRRNNETLRSNLMAVASATIDNLCPYAIPVENQVHADRLAIPYTTSNPMPHRHPIHAYARRKCCKIDLPKYIKSDFTVISMSDDNLAWLLEGLGGDDCPYKYEVINPIIALKDHGRYDAETIPLNVFELPKPKYPTCIIHDAGHYIPEANLATLALINPQVRMWLPTSVYPLERLVSKYSLYPTLYDWTDVGKNLMVYIPEKDTDNTYVQSRDPGHLVLHEIVLEGGKEVLRGGIVESFMNVHISMWSKYPMESPKFQVISLPMMMPIPRVFRGMPNDLAWVRVTDYVKSLEYAFTLGDVKSKDFWGKSRQLVEDQVNYIPIGDRQWFIKVLMQIARMDVTTDLQTKEYNHLSTEVYYKTMGHLVRWYHKMFGARYANRHRRMINEPKGHMIIPTASSRVRRVHNNLYSVSWKYDKSARMNLREEIGWIARSMRGLQPGSVYESYNFDSEGFLIFDRALGITERNIRVFGLENLKAQLAEDYNQTFIPKHALQKPIVYKYRQDPDEVKEEDAPFGEEEEESVIDTDEILASDVSTNTDSDDTGDGGDDDGGGGNPPGGPPPAYKNDFKKPWSGSNPFMGLIEDPFASPADPVIKKHNPFRNREDCDQSSIISFDEYVDRLVKEGSYREFSELIKEEEEEESSVDEDRHPAIPQRHCDSCPDPVDYVSDVGGNKYLELCEQIHRIRESTLPHEIKELSVKTIMELERKRVDTLHEREHIPDEPQDAIPLYQPLTSDDDIVAAHAARQASLPMIDEINPQTGKILSWHVSEVVKPQDELQLAPTPGVKMSNDEWVERMNSVRDPKHVKDKRKLDSDAAMKDWEKLRQKRPSAISQVFDYRGKILWDMVFPRSVDKRYKDVPYQPCVSYPDIEYPEEDCLLQALSKLTRKAPTELLLIAIRLYPADQQKESRYLSLKILHSIGCSLGVGIHVEDFAGRQIHRYGMTIGGVLKLKMTAPNHVEAVGAGLPLTIRKVFKPINSPNALFRSLIKQIETIPGLSFKPWIPENTRASLYVRAMMDGQTGLMGKNPLNFDNLKGWEELAGIVKKSVMLAVYEGDPGCRKSSSLQKILSNQKYHKNNMFTFIAAINSLCQDWKNKLGVQTKMKATNKGSPPYICTTFESALAKGHWGWLTITDEDKYPKGFHALQQMIFPWTTHMVMLFDRYQAQWHEPDERCLLNDPDILSNGAMAAQYSNQYLVGTWRFGPNIANFFRMPTFSNHPGGFHFGDSMPMECCDIVRYFPHLTQQELEDLWNTRCTFYASHAGKAWANESSPGDKETYAGSIGLSVGLAIMEIDSRVLRFTDYRILYTVLTRAKHMIFVKRYSGHGDDLANIQSHYIWKNLLYYADYYREGRPVQIQAHHSICIRDVLGHLPSEVKEVLSGRPDQIRNMVFVEPYLKFDYKNSFIDHDPANAKVGARLQRNGPVYKDQAQFGVHIIDDQFERVRKAEVREAAPRSADKLRTHIPPVNMNAIKELHDHTVMERYRAELSMKGLYSIQKPDLPQMRLDAHVRKAALVKKMFPHLPRRAANVEVDKHLKGLDIRDNPLYYDPIEINYGQLQIASDPASFAAGMAQRVKFSTKDLNEQNFAMEEQMGIDQWNALCKYLGWEPDDRVPITDYEYQNAVISFQERRADRSEGLQMASLNRADPDYTNLLTAKSQWKMKDLGPTKAKPLQTIMIRADNYLFKFGWVGIHLLNKLLETVPPYFYLHAGRSIEDMKSWFATHGDVEEHEMLDLTALDTSVRGGAVLVMSKLMRRFSIPEDLIEAYIADKMDFHTRNLTFAIMTFSGEIFTWLGNTIDVASRECAMFDMPPGWPMASSGDDIWRPAGLPKSTFEVKHAGIDSKQEKREIASTGSFCSFLIKRGYLLKDPIILYKRLKGQLTRGRHDEIALGYFELFSHNYNLSDRLYSLLDENQIEHVVATNRIMFNLKKYGYKGRLPWEKLDVNEALVGRSRAELNLLVKHLDVELQSDSNFMNSIIPPKFDAYTTSEAFY